MASNWVSFSSFDSLFTNFEELKRRLESILELSEAQKKKKKRLF